MISDQSRLSRFAAILDREGVDAYLAWSPVTMGYLQGFHEGAHERFLVLALHRDGRVRMICPALSASQAKRAGIEDVRGWKDGEDPLALFSELADDWELRTGIMAVDNELPAHLLLAMQSVLPAALFQVGQRLIAELMRVKSASELDSLRRAGQIADDAWDEVLPQIKAGMTELTVGNLIEAAMRSRGGRPDFCIVAAGGNAAEPHHLSDNTVLQSGDSVVIDFGCSVEDGYRSDITRTICVGNPSEALSKVYEVVYEAQASARRAVKAGVAAQDIDRAARKVIGDAGYGEYFVHRTGHGLGVRGHEEPYIVEGNSEPLQTGEVFSVEPGIYIPGKLGVRIENIVVCEEGGHRSLNREPSPTITSI